MAKRKKADDDSSAPPETRSPTDPTPETFGSAPEANGSPKRRPVLAFRCSTDRSTYVEASVWENEIRPEQGEPFMQYVTTCQRSYRNGGGEWATNHSYRAHDLPILGHPLMRAHAFITDKRVIEDVPF